MPEWTSHYPDFDVMREEEHWDPHTREIVNKRLDSPAFYPYHFFTQEEGDTLYRLCSILLDDYRHPVIVFVIHHFDSTLKADIGESQRKRGVPRQSTLIRDGLALLDQVCSKQFGERFVSLEEKQQKQLVHQLLSGEFPVPSDQAHFPVKDFMDKLFNEAVAAYYSHPSIWSEIGYAGPAYPRGYVRSEFGLTDPWEAKRNGK